MRRTDYYAHSRAVVFLVLMGLLLSPVAARAHGLQPALKWEPQILSGSVARGDIGEFTVRLKANRALENLRLTASPGIAKITSISPSFIESVEEGQGVDVRITIDAPFRPKSPVAVGLVNVATSNGLRTAVFPLPIVVHTFVAKTDALLSSVGTIGITAPPGWTVLGDNITSSLFSASTMAKVDQGELHTPPDVAFSIVPNLSGASLQDFLNEFAEGQFAQYVNSRTQEIVGHSGRVMDADGNAVAFEPVRAAFVPLGSDFLVVLGFTPSAADFDVLLSTLTLQ